MRSGNKGLNDRLQSNLALIRRAQSRKEEKPDSINIARELLQYLFGYNGHNIAGPYKSCSNFHGSVSYHLKEGPPHTSVTHYLVLVNEFGLPLEETFLDKAAYYCNREGIGGILLTNCIQWDVYSIVERNRFQSFAKYYAGIDITEINLDDEKEYGVFRQISASMQRDKLYVLPWHYGDSLQAPSWWYN